jgi:transposase InsO family protein
MYIKLIFSIVKNFFRNRNELVWENAILKHQIQILRRKRKRIEFKSLDKIILVWLTKRLDNWKKFVFVVQPETLIRWHRNIFALYWGRKYSKKAGRPVIHGMTIHLIRKIALANPLWGAPRVHGELLKLGIDIAQSTVEKYMPKRKRRTPQTWKTFLKNHSKEIVAIDFFIVPTLKLKMLWNLVVLSHDRRKILHFAVTENPSRTWTAQQLRNIFPFRKMPRFIIHDRDRNLWGLSKLGSEEIITAYKSPWQNAYVERVIGSIRRECTDHLIVFSEKHMRRILSLYKSYYNKSRTHISLNKDSPETRKAKKRGRIIITPKVGGLHSEFSRRAA